MAHLYLSFQKVHTNENFPGVFLLRGAVLFGVSFENPSLFKGRILRFSRAMDPYRTESTIPWIFPLGRRNTYCSESSDFPLSSIQEASMIFHERWNTNAKKTNCTWTFL
jgi:hypothetical protein